MAGLCSWHGWLSLFVLALALVQASAQQCGKRQLWQRPLIAKGTISALARWPWHVALFQRDSVTKEPYKCGGTIINLDTVLTANHCLADHQRMPIAKELLIVRAGMFDLNDDGNMVQEKGVIEIFVPPGASMRNFRHDIAVLKMHTKFTFNDYVQPICIRPVPYDISKLVGVFGTVVGWGRTETSDISAKLRQAKVPVVSAYDCLDSDPYSFRLVATGKVYCAGSRNGTSSCNGDSGGGMYFRTGSHWYLRGITSFALEDENLLGKCDTYGYVGYTDVAMYLDWLRDRGVQLLHSKQDASSKKSVPRDRSKAHLRLAVDTGTKEFLQQHKGKLFLRVGLKGRKPESLFQ